MLKEKAAHEQILYDLTIHDGHVNRDIADFEREFLPKFVKDGLLIADVGCGYGRHLIYFELKGNWMVGIDFALDDIQEARERAVKFGIHPNIILADARTIPLRSESFDYVLYMGSALSEKYWAWLTKEDRRKWIEEMTRICKPQGFVLVEVGNRHSSLKSSIRWIKHYLIAIKSMLTGGRIEIGDYYEEELKCWFHEFTVNEIKNLFKELPVQVKIHKPDKLFFPIFMASVKKLDKFCLKGIL